MKYLNGIPVYEAQMSAPGSGMLNISLVDYPAVESDFLAFAKEGEKEKAPLVRMADEEKRLVFGVVMRADWPIYRIDRETGEEYYIVYTPEVIRAMAQKYLEENKQNIVTIMHDDDAGPVEGVTMDQLFFKDSGAGVSPAGFDDIKDGSLFAEFHVANDDVWNQIKDGTLRGFSLEGIFSLTESFARQARPETPIEKILNGMKRDITSIKAALARKVAVKLGEVATDKGTLVWEGDGDIAVDDAVTLGSGEDAQPAEDGDYTAEDGRVISVADGKVTAIAVAEEKGAEEGDNAGAPAPQEQETQALRAFRAIKAAFEASYSDKMMAISKALDAMEAEAYIVDAGDDFAIADVWDEDGNDKYVHYSVTWNGDGTVSLSDPYEVRQAWVKVSDGEPAQGAPAEAGPADESMARQVASLMERVARLEGVSAGTGAHDAYRRVTEVGAPAPKADGTGMPEGKRRALAIMSARKK